MAEWDVDTTTEAGPVAGMALHPTELIEGSGPVSPAIRTVLDFIGENFSRPLSLAELAGRCGLSLHRFVTVFRTQVGIPPHQYLCRIRVRQAQHLLRQGVPAAAVAIDTGFCDQSHLNRHFKRQCGVTPGHFAVHARRPPPHTAHA